MKRFLFLSFFLLPSSFFLLSSSFASSDSSKIQAQIDAERKKGAEINAAIRESDKDMAKTQKELVAATKKMSELESESDSLKTRLETLRGRDEELGRKIAESQARLREAAAALLQIAASPASESLAAGESVGSAILLSGIADRFDAELRESEAAMKELNETRRDMTKQQKSVDSASLKLAEQKARLDKLMAARAANNAKLRLESGESAARLKELAARAKSVADLSDSVAIAPAGKAALGRLRTPVRGMLIRGFGDKSALGLVSDGWYVRTRRGETVVAPDDAVVEFADSFKGRNKVLILNHGNGYYTVLAQLDELSVIPGQSVLSGEPLGRMGEGNPELYLELRGAKRAVDPAKFFDKPKGR
ncbi:MAG: peptidoglycan DD-metalloendopeptidase family protein [Rickettsiales bacterium]|jgi:septal ring factor EnvC (AmiA/AmiB activator)|nr:peptidoglycan DD-metalloendopeptidase family protein [Rickettsiales bacterium]